MESMNRTMVPEVPTVPAEGSMRLHFQRLLKDWPSSAWQWATGWRRTRETQAGRGGTMAEPSSSRRPNGQFLLNEPPVTAEWTSAVECCVSAWPEW